MNYLLFTTTSCPKCPAFKEFVIEKLNFSGEILDENTMNFSEKISEFEVTGAPCLLIFEDNKEIFRGSENYEVEDFLKN